MEEKFTSVASALCPERDYVIQKDRPVYFTSELSRLIQARDSLLKKARVSRSQGKRKKKKLWNKAAQKRNEVRYLLKSTKREHVMSSMELNRNNPKKILAVSKFPLK